jgi:hypothetical protein
MSNEPTFGLNYPARDEPLVVIAEDDSRTVPRLVKNILELGIE